MGRHKYDKFPSDMLSEGTIEAIKKELIASGKIDKNLYDWGVFSKYPLIPTLWMIFEDSTFAFRSGDKHRSRRIYGK